MPDQIEKTYTVKATTLQKFMDYFSGRPYGEVFLLVGELVSLVKEQDAVQVLPLNTAPNVDTTTQTTNA